MQVAGVGVATIGTAVLEERGWPWHVGSALKACSPLLLPADLGSLSFVELDLSFLVQDALSVCIQVFGVRIDIGGGLFCDFFSSAFHLHSQISIAR